MIRPSSGGGRPSRAVSPPVVPSRRRPLLGAVPVAPPPRHQDPAQATSLGRAPSGVLESSAAIGGDSGAALRSTVSRSELGTYSTVSGSASTLSEAGRPSKAKNRKAKDRMKGNAKALRHPAAASAAQRKRHPVVGHGDLGAIAPQRKRQAGCQEPIPSPPSVPAGAVVDLDHAESTADSGKRRPKGAELADSAAPPPPVAATAPISSGGGVSGGRRGGGGGVSKSAALELAQRHLTLQPPPPPPGSAPEPTLGHVPSPVCSPLPPRDPAAAECNDCSKTIVVRAGRGGGGSDAQPTSQRPVVFGRSRSCSSSSPLSGVLLARGGEEEQEEYARTMPSVVESKLDLSDTIGIRREEQQKLRQAQLAIMRTTVRKDVRKIQQLLLAPDTADGDAHEHEEEDDDDDGDGDAAAAAVAAVALLDDQGHLDGHALLGTRPAQVPVVAGGRPTPLGARAPVAAAGAVPPRSKSRALADDQRQFLFRLPGYVNLLARQRAFPDGDHHDHYHEDDDDDEAEDHRSAAAVSRSQSADLPSSRVPHGATRVLLSTRVVDALQTRSRSAASPVRAATRDHVGPVPGGRLSDRIVPPRLETMNALEGHGALPRTITSARARRRAAGGGGSATAGSTPDWGVSTVAHLQPGPVSPPLRPLPGPPEPKLAWVPRHVDEGARATSSSPTTTPAVAAASDAAARRLNTRRANEALVALEFKHARDLQRGGGVPLGHGK